MPAMKLAENWLERLIRSFKHALKDPQHHLVLDRVNRLCPDVLDLLVVLPILGELVQQYL